MQGAQIDSSNSDCYGDGAGTAGCATRTVTSASYAGGNLATNYAAGNWEYCTATSAAAAAVGVVCAGPGGGTVNAYQTAAASGTAGAYRYQVVRVPQYASVTLTADVVPLAWGGATGGVLALQASGTVNMGGFNLDASARGFRGGGVTFATPYGPPVIDPVDGSSFYRAVAGALAGGEREGNFKAEGIAGTPQLVYNGSAQVNTGSDGYPNGSRGRGAPGNAGGGGNNQNGGGGGGGNGGGLIVVRAAAMAGTGSVLANGANGFEPNFTVGTCTDAGGGAGAGGTLALAVGTGLVGRTLQANGGNGANSSYSQHGPGGGGGGGAVYYNTSAGAPSAVATGGANGTDRGNFTPPAGPWFSTVGSGSVLSAATSAFTPACSTVLAVTKTDGIASVQAGGTTSYTVTFTNAGATAANGAVAKDTPSAGLSCAVQSCTASTTPIAAVCPVAGQWPSLLTPGGVVIPGLPALATVSFIVACNVTATGQ
jgi:uncharacterized repeat protein (TIGR01451 family)